MKNIELIRGDITKQETDAIVNAANKSLLGGGGVDGAIHRAAGPGLLEECRKLGGCETGDAKITKGHKLPAKYVIHTVGPVWNGGKYDEEKLLESAYKSSLQVAKDNKLSSVSFPNISTGVYGFPKQKAAEIAVNTVRTFLNENSLPEKVSFVAFDEENYELYWNLLKNS
jgi:O-acetyl-ADP-ribose deacetylase (regulator of RNase III)